jgi:hypothetical protein
VLAHKNQWKLEVQTAVNTKHTQKMKQECMTTKNNVKTVKSKTTFILDKLYDKYKKGPLRELMNYTRHKTRVVIIARAHMLECGKI